MSAVLVYLRREVAQATNKEVTQIIDEQVHAPFRRFHRLEPGARHARLRRSCSPAGGCGGGQPLAADPSLAAAPRCNPFAFPSNIDFAFGLLVAVVLGTSLLIHLSIANTVDSGFMPQVTLPAALRCMPGRW